MRPTSRFVAVLFWVGLAAPDVRAARRRLRRRISGSCRPDIRLSRRPTPERGALLTSRRSWRMRRSDVRPDASAGRAAMRRGDLAVASVGDARIDGLEGRRVSGRGARHAAGGVWPTAGGSMSALRCRRRPPSSTRRDRASVPMPRRAGRRAGVAPRARRGRGASAVRTLARRLAQFARLGHRARGRQPTTCVARRGCHHRKARPRGAVRAPIGSRSGDRARLDRPATPRSGRARASRRAGRRWSVDRGVEPTRAPERGCGRPAPILRRPCLASFPGSSTRTTVS